MIEIKRKKDCCGCQACVQICPKACITMQSDEEGFGYPCIDTDLCVNCHLCEKTCPINNPKGQTKKMDLEAYAAYAIDNELRASSSSGGLFSKFAEKVIADGGIVFGAAWDENFLTSHTAVETLEELSRLRGSKYLQSRIGNAYIEAKKYLEQGREVLFSGTACQIAGLKLYLGREYTNLLTIDVLCHGVPSPKVWEKYLAEQEKGHGAHIKQVCFRHKKYGWKQYSMLLEFSDARIYECIHTEDKFMRLFLSDICLRPSCHACKFKEFPRMSDITLGDCWGVESHSPEMDDDKGTSVVIINSEKGKKAKEMIESQCVWKKAPLDILLPGNADSRKSVGPHRNRRKFFVILNEGGSMERLLKTIQPSFVERIKNKMRRIKRECRRLCFFSK